MDALCGDDRDDARRRGAEIMAVLRQTIADMRTIAYGLRSPALDQLGLGKALENFCKETAERPGMGIDFFAADIEYLTLDFDTEIKLYRMVQEAVNNMVKHAAASQAAVRLVMNHTDLVIRIEEDGREFDVARHLAQAAEKERLGLRSMEERTRLIGGTMEIQSLAGTGTRIAFRIPVNGSGRHEQWTS